ncbi:MAG: thrombospondin type 3 repeat-containing protein [Verrucomicrobiota bacterium]
MKFEWPLFLILLSATTLGAGPFPDDHGSTPSAARAVVPDTPATAGAIEIDVDEDWFSFLALPGVEYEVEIMTNTVWDLDGTLYAPGGLLRLRDETTADDSQPIRIQWTNTGAAATCFLKVNGFIEFTTGDYAVAVRTLNYADTDADNLLDHWETGFFGALIATGGEDPDGDGINNADEYLMGTDPTDPLSVLEITSIGRSNDLAVTWRAVRWGNYEVQVLDDLQPGMAWTPLSTRLHLSGSGEEIYQDESYTNHAHRFYRIEFKP